MSRPRCKEDRVRSIMVIMAEDRFERGKTYKSLADDWGMRRDVVRRDAAEASRRMSALLDPDMSAEWTEALLKEAANAALEAEGADKARELTRIAEAVARISGIDRGRAQPKVQITVPPTAQAPWVVEETKEEEKT